MASDGIRFGVTASSVGPDVRAVSRISRSLGFSGLQFDAVSSGLDLTTLSASGRREFRLLMSGQDQQIVGLRMDLGAKGMGPGADVDRAIDRLEQAMEAAAGLAAPLVCVEIGPLPPAAVTEKPKPAVNALQAGLLILPESMTRPTPAPPPPPAAAPDPGFVSQINAAMVELGQRADRYSVVLAFRSDLASFASLETVLKDAACPWFGIDLDPVSILRDAWEADEVFSRLGSLIRHVRARDAIRGADRRTKPAVIGQGSVEWEALIASLAQSDYQGWITLDPVDLSDRTSAATLGLKYLKNVSR